MVDRITWSRSFLFDSWKRKKEEMFERWQISTRERYLREKVIWFHVNRPPYVHPSSFFLSNLAHETGRLSSISLFLWIMHRLNLSVITRGKRGPRNRAPLSSIIDGERKNIIPHLGTILKEIRVVLFSVRFRCLRMPTIYWREKRWLKLSQSKDLVEHAISSPSRSYSRTTRAFPGYI